MGTYLLWWPIQITFLMVFTKNIGVQMVAATIKINKIMEIREFHVKTGVLKITEFFLKSRNFGKIKLFGAKLAQKRPILGQNALFLGFLGHILGKNGQNKANSSRFEPIPSNGARIYVANSGSPRSGGAILEKIG